MDNDVTKFSDYLHEHNKKNLHNKMTKMTKHFPEKLQDMNNIILYGISGI